MTNTTIWCIDKGVAQVPYTAVGSNKKDKSVGYIYIASMQGALNKINKSIIFMRGHK